jgi:hypothetical protein
MDAPQEVSSWSGLGLRNVLRRLDLIYPGKYNLVIRNTGNLFMVELQLKSYIGKFPYLQLEGAFTNPLKAIEFIRLRPVQLLFLDIQM